MTIVMRKFSRELFEAVRVEARLEGKGWQQVTEELWRAYLETQAADREVAGGHHLVADYAEIRVRPVL